MSDIYEGQRHSGDRTHFVGDDCPKADSLRESIEKAMQPNTLPKLPENVEKELSKWLDIGDNMQNLRRAIAAALLRAEAQGLEIGIAKPYNWQAIHKEFRAQADALERKPNGQ